MKILYIITQADGGGAQKYVLSLAQYFNGAIAAGTEADSLFKHAKTAGIQTFKLNFLKRPINPLFDFLACWEIRKLIKLYQPDIVHINSSKAGILGSFAGIGLKTKIIFTAHGFIFNEPLSHFLKTFYIALEKIASNYRDFIITVSKADKTSALKYKLISPEKIQTIYNGIAKTNFISKEQARIKLQIPNNKIIIGLISNLYKTKGIDVLINSINQLEQNTIDKILVYIIGQGPEKRNLKLQISNFKLSEKIILLGTINQAAEYLKAFDIFILPSKKEGFPYSVLEAMQAGLPIIASNVGGNLEALGDAGILVKPEDSAELSRAINKLIRDSDQQAKFSKKALTRANLFTETKMFSETNEIYKKILP